MFVPVHRYSSFLLLVSVAGSLQQITNADRVQRPASPNTQRRDPHFSNVDAAVCLK